MFLGSSVRSSQSLWEWGFSYASWFLLSLVGTVRSDRHKYTCITLLRRDRSQSRVSRCSYRGVFDFAIPTYKFSGLLAKSLLVFLAIFLRRPKYQFRPNPKMTAHGKAIRLSMK